MGSAQDKRELRNKRTSEKKALEKKTTTAIKRAELKRIEKGKRKGEGETNNTFSLKYFIVLSLLILILFYICKEN